ncbi:MAG: mitochondrial fission ELM1 family protein [Armatimonadetes bacterium]|nr:mitochondrial fission ELM1 family protein [Akkermansiaceae bacterium]
MKILWLKDDKIGHTNKVRGLLRALGEQLDFEVIECELFWRWSGIRQLLSRMGNAGLRLPVRWFISKLPDLQGVNLIISSGGSTQWPNAALAKQFKIHNIFIGSTRKMNPACFSLIALLDPPSESPPYFRFHLIPSLVTPTAAMLAADASGFGSGKSWGLLIGGDGEGVYWSDREYISLVEIFLSQAINAGVGIWIASSRRTPRHIESKVRSLVEKSGILVGACWFHDPQPEAVTLLVMMGACMRLCVTIDSMSMAHEAISSGRPVIAVCPQHGGGAQLSSNVKKLEASGYIVMQQISNMSIADAEPLHGWKRIKDDPSAPLAAAVMSLIGIAQN